MIQPANIQVRKRQRFLPALFFGLEAKGDKGSGEKA
jgi:hypothetical protein